VTPDEARAIALALPGAAEQDHHGKPSFRVDGKIFATLWSDERMNVMLDEGGIRTALDAHPEACVPVHWGTRLAAVGVLYAEADRELAARLLEDAWEGKGGRRGS
jgi:hypothetical protein